MQKLVVLFAANLALALAFVSPVDNNGPGRQIPIPKPTDEKPNKFDWDVRKPGILDLKTTGTFYDDGGKRLDGSASYSKNFVDHSQKIGAGLNYHDYNSRLGAGLNVQDLDRAGTRVQAELTKTLLKDRFSNIEGGLRYGQTFNTPYGNSEPFFGGFVRGRF
ncbi:uncharacterized protein LOC135140904 [Zophobas morio]|uniref:uncharacterized protein LOC135140826 n=1 Tax=Zophobas morio TaxID=2755281 RepID=UPI0030834518